MNKSSSGLKLLALFLGLMALFTLSACQDKKAEVKKPGGEPTVQTGDGLVLEGEGPFPAVLLARSRNTLSNEENQLILQEISQELDKLVDLASQLEVIDDSMIIQQ